MSLKIFLASLFDSFLIYEIPCIMHKLALNSTVFSSLMSEVVERFRAIDNRRITYGLHESTMIAIPMLADSTLTIIVSTVLIRITPKTMTALIMTTAAITPVMVVAIVIVVWCYRR